MSRYGVFGSAGAASATAATAGIMKVDNPSSTTMASARIYEWSIGPGAAAEDSNYAIQMKRQSTAGTWTSVTPSPLNPKSSASVTLAGRASNAAGTAGVVLGTWGFNQRGGLRWVAIPGGELVVPLTFSNGIILEYKTVQGTAVNEASIMFEE
jgi:hypothetical protein